MSKLYSRGFTKLTPTETASVTASSSTLPRCPQKMELTMLMRKIISCARNCEEQKGGHPRPSWGHPAPAAPGPTHHRACERRQRGRLSPHVRGQRSPQAPRAAPLRGVGWLRKRDGRAQTVLGGLHGAGSDAGRTCTWSRGRSDQCGDPPLAPPRPGAPCPRPTVTECSARDKPRSGCLENVLLFTQQE